jgi:hypothetical protein
VLGLLDQPLLLGRRVAMHVASHGRDCSRHRGQDLSSMGLAGRLG